MTADDAPGGPEVGPQDGPRFDGKVALVTGGSRGIGLGIAEAFAAAGAHVCVTARHQAGLDDAVARLGTLGGGGVLAVPGSVGDAGHARECVDRAMERFGRVDVLVNNAATNPAYGPLMAVEPGAVRKTLEVNLEAPLWFVQAAWHAWMAQSGGVVINISTQGTLGVAAGLGIYESSKAALVHLTRQLAGELAPKVRVNCISPGLIRTRLSRMLWEADEAAAAAHSVFGRIGLPQDVASVALFLASDAARWVTGVDLLVDGGSEVRAAASSAG